MKLDGLGFRDAVELLHGQPLPAVSTAVAARVPAVCPLDPESDDAGLAGQVVDYYHQQLSAESAGWAYLKKRGLARRDLVDHFRLGFSDRSLGQTIPNKLVAVGQLLRERLEVLGLFRVRTGHEHFRGSLVVPIFDGQGNVSERYGRKVTERLRKGTPKHLYLPGPHRGVWNRAGLVAGGGTVVLCEALIDALTLWAHSIPHVTATYGTGGFTADHEAAFAAAGVHTVVIAFDADAAGDAAAEKLAGRLISLGLTVKRARPPAGQDVNAWALELGLDQAPAQLAAWIDAATFWGGAPGSSTVAVAPTDAATADAPAVAANDSAADVVDKTESADNPPITPITSPPGSTPESAPAAVPAVPVGVGAEAPVLTSTPDGDLLMRSGPRVWRVRGCPAEPGQSIRVQLRVSLGETDHLDHLDLCSARARQAFVKAAADEMGVQVDVVKKEMGRILRGIEQWQDQERRAALQAREAAASRSPSTGMSPKDRDAALELLQDPQLVDRVLADLDACGLVGETANKLAVYLAATSRLLRRPLGILVQSSSSAGKSTVVDRVLDLMPDEQAHRYASLSENALVYEDRDIRHHILAIAELEGAQEAIYALKLLQSDGQLSRATVAKQADTGTVAARELRVEGPVALFLTTTDRAVDPELQNRCLTLTISEDAAQTQAIHDQQRLARTIDGLHAQVAREAVRDLHRNAQRLLQPLTVLNPYARQLTFRSDRVRMRRDHEKYLALIDAVTLLHQHQRTTKTIEIGSKTITCVEATLADVAIANDLMHHLLGRSLDDLPPQTRRLLGLIVDWADGQRDGDNDRQTPRFTRRQLQAFTGWSYGQLRIHLDRLVEQDYVVQYGAGRGGRLLYEVVDDGRADDAALCCPGLIDVAALAQNSEKVPVGMPMMKVCTPEPPSLHPPCRGVAGQGGANLGDCGDSGLDRKSQSLQGLSGGLLDDPKLLSLASYFSDVIDSSVAVATVAGSDVTAEAQSCVCSA
jgi:DNA primase